jgi:hypothetical protein
MPLSSSSWWAVWGAATDLLVMPGSVEQDFLFYQADWILPERISLLFSSLYSRLSSLLLHGHESHINCYQTPVELTLAGKKVAGPQLTVAF